MWGGGGGGICAGVFVHGGKCPGGIYPGGKCPGGKCPDAILTKEQESSTLDVINTSKLKFLASHFRYLLKCIRAKMTSFCHVMKPITFDYNQNESNVA